MDAVVNFTASNGYPPSIRELMVVLNVSSPTTVKDHLDALERKRWIERDPGTARGLRVIRS